MSASASSSSSTGLLTAGITFSVFTAAIVAIHLVANWHQISKLHADDCKTLLIG